MRMKIIARWQLPKEATEAQWRANMAKFKQMAFHFAKWGLAGILLLLVLKEPLNVTNSSILLFVGAVLVFILMIYAQLVINRFDKNVRVIHEGGLFQTPPVQMHLWKNIEWFSISNDPAIPELKMLRFKVRRLKNPRIWHFNPKEVSEAVIREAMKNHGVEENRQMV